MKKITAGFILIIAIVNIFLLLANWGIFKKKKEKELKFVMVPKGVHPYYESCYEGFKAAAVKYGVKVDMVSPPKFELALQVKVIEDLIVQQVDGIAISAVDDKGLIPVINEAADAGVKVITFDAPAFSTKALTYIGTVNKQAGYEAGIKMAKLMNESGEVAILQGGLDATNLNERTQGFREALAKSAPNVKLVAVEDNKGDYAIAVKKTEMLLEVYPKLKAIFGVSAYGAPAAATVIKEQKKAGKILIGGFDDLKDTLEGIVDGSIQFCLVQKTYKMGWLSVERLLDAVNGRPLPKIIDTGVLIVDRKNVSNYMAEMIKEFNQ